MGIKIQGTKKQKICLLIQVILLITVIAIDIVANIYDLHNVVLLKISEYCSFLIVFILPVIMNSNKDKDKNINKEEDKTKIE